MSKKSKRKCLVCGEFMNEYFYGEEMSTLYECPNEKQLWHKDTKELILLKAERKEINDRIKIIKLRLSKKRH